MPSHVQTNTTPNEVISFRRADDGSLDRIGSVATGGDGSNSPHLQSQGSVSANARWTALVGNQRGSGDLASSRWAPMAFSLALRARVETGSTSVKPRRVRRLSGLY